METKKIFIIHPVADLKSALGKRIDNYVSGLEKLGHIVYVPGNDTKQDGTSSEICVQNMLAIKSADEVHIFYDNTSKGSHFDMGVAFACNKKIVIAEEVTKPDKKAMKSFNHLLREWENSETSLWWLDAPADVVGTFDEIDDKMPLYQEVFIKKDDDPVGVIKFLSKWRDIEEPIKNERLLIAVKAIYDSKVESLLSGNKITTATYDRTINLPENLTLSKF